MRKRILTITGVLLGAVCLLLGGLILFLTVTEYRPQPVQDADHQILTHGAQAVGRRVTLCSWNIGYGGLGAESDFFMDGGSMVSPPSQDAIRKNLEGIRAFVASTPADAWLFQEVDVNSARTGGQNQFSLLNNTVAGSAAMAYNYKCAFVPIPFPPMGRVESGIATMTTRAMADGAQRVSLPCPFSWPVSTANLKRCLLVTRLPVEGSDSQLVLINLHLEAYESGEGRIAQTRQLLELMQAEYEAGNYVIAGGDFNQSFPGTLDTFPIQDPGTWAPGLLSRDDLPDGWQYAFDEAAPTCRLLDKPWDGTNQLYVIDGFILSPNVALERVETVSLDFECTDHEPVLLEVTLS